MWLEHSGNVAADDDFLSTISNKENDLYVGTDSHSFGEHWLFATVICCHKPGNGGRYFTKRIRIIKNNLKTLADRLLHEAHLSIEAAQEVENLTGRKPKVHVDVSKKGTNSARFHVSVTSYVKGMGYDVTSKPDSWASSCVADRNAR